MNGNVSMLAYCKLVLKSVCLYNRRLFKKEYRKSLRLICKQEAIELRTWLRKNKFDNSKKQLMNKLKIK
jgi:hypothetical protein